MKLFFITTVFLFTVFSSCYCQENERGYGKSIELLIADADLMIGDSLLSVESLLYQSKKNQIELQYKTVLSLYKRLSQSEVCDSIIFSFVKKYCPNISYVQIYYDIPQEKYFHYLPILSEQIISLHVEFPETITTPEMYHKAIDFENISRCNKLKEISIREYPSNEIKWIRDVDSLNAIVIESSLSPLLQDYSFFKNIKDIDVCNYDPINSYISQYSNSYYTNNIFYKLRPSYPDSSNIKSFSYRYLSDSIAFMGNFKNHKFNGKWTFYDIVPIDSDYRNYYWSCANFYFGYLKGGISDCYLNRCWHLPIDSIGNLVANTLLNQDTLYMRKNYVIGDSIFDIYRRDTITSKVWALLWLYRLDNQRYFNIINLFFKNQKEFYIECSKAWEEYKYYMSYKSYPIFEIIYDNNKVKRFIKLQNLADNSIQYQYDFFDDIGVIRFQQDDEVVWSMNDELNNQVLKVEFHKGQIYNYSDSSPYFTNTNKSLSYNYFFSPDMTTIIQNVKNEKARSIREIKIQENQFVVKRKGMLIPQKINIK
jgi:hypothetical protein